MKILGIAGSLRKQSYNKALIHEAAAVASDGMHVVSYALDDVPLYNGDLDTDNQPQGVTAFKQAIHEAAGLLIATPEYNFGIPGVLKNALDWASRPMGRSPLTNKPVAIVGASPSMVGTARAQGQLKQVLLGMSMAVYPQAEFLVAAAHEKISAEGTLDSSETRDRLSTLLMGFGEWIKQLAQ